MEGSRERIVWSLLTSLSLTNPKKRFLEKRTVGLVGGVVEQGFPVFVLYPVVPVQPVVVSITPVDKASSFFRVRAPTNPEPVVNPTGVRVSFLYLFWNLMTARLVAGPKVVVSLPLEPAPVVATCVVGSWFKSI